MNTRHHRPRAQAHKWRHSVATILALMLGIVVAPAALAEPLEYAGPLEYVDEGVRAPVVDWPQRQLENLIGQEAGAGTDDNASYRAQQDAYLRFLEQKAESASDDQPAIEISADDSGQPWLLGVGAVVIVAVAGFVLAIVRPRRIEAVTAVERNREHVSV